MSKFDAILKKIEEGLPPVTNQQQNQGAGLPPKPATNNPVQQQQEKQALEQFAKAVGVDMNALQKFIETQKQQQQQQQKQQPQQNNQQQTQTTPAV